MYTLQQIKDIYYCELASSDTLRMGLDEYIRQYFVPCYDSELEFMGYERG